MNATASKPKIVVVCGPTAAGKTTVAIGLARRYNGEIINADSRQIFRWMDIGTAKPTPEERARAPHHLTDFVEPDRDFDARQFARMARRVAAELIGKYRLPFVVGGTGLYIKAMLHGLFEDHGSSPEIREALKKEAEKHGGPSLHRRLEKLDPMTAAKVHPNDVYRIVRALEVFEITGRPISEFHRGHRFSEKIYDAMKIGVYLERAILYDRIDRRVEKMISDGLVEEVRGLLERGFSPELKSMKAIGYGRIVEFLKGSVSLDDAVELLKRDTRRYAKRQMTWFRSDPEIVWVKPEDIHAAIPAIENFLENRT